MKNALKTALTAFCILALLGMIRDSRAVSFEGKKIRKINVKGLVNTGESEVLDALTFKTGSVVTGPEISQSIRNIYRTGRFDDVRIDMEEKAKGVEVTVILEERPLIKQIEFKGNDEIGETDLSEAVKDILAADMVLNESRINEAVAVILDKYAEDGFEDTTVNTFKIIDQKKKTCRLIIRIKEGDEVRVQVIKIKGTRNFKEDKIIGVMDTHIDDWLHSGIFKKTEYEKDKQNIIQFYKKNGYINARITDDKLVYRIEGKKRKKGKKLYITITLTEGEQYNFGAYTITGNSLFTEKEIREVLEMKQGEIFNQETFEQDVQRLQQKYSERGYIFAGIRPYAVTDDEKRVVGYDIRIAEGEIAHIESIILRGNTKTKDYVVLRELIIKEGEIFNTAKIRRSQERIYNLGFFKNVVLDVKPGSAEGLMNLIIEVEEQMTGLITLGLVYGTVDGFGGYEEVSENNLLGRAIRIHERVEYQQKKQNYEVGLAYPYIFDSPYTLSFNVFYKNRSEIQVSSIYTNADSVKYNKQEWGLSFGASRRISEYMALSAFYGIELYKYYGFTGIPYDAGLQEKMDRNRDFVKSSVTLKFDYDSRDNIFNPTRGFHFNQGWDIVGGPLGGDDKYLKFITDVSKYYPLFWKFVMVLHLNYGLITPSFDNKPISINADDLLFVGGVESVRGYQYYNNDWNDQWGRGGLSRIFANLEYRFPIAEQIIWGVLFVDGGNVWAKGYQANFNYKEYFFSTGWGFRIQIPMLPIRLYLSKKFWYDRNRNSWYLDNKTIGDWEFDFSVGGLF